MPELTGANIFFGLLIAALAWVLLNKRGEPRRLPVWGALAIAAIAALASPPVVSGFAALQERVPFLSRVTEGAVFIAVWIALLLLTLFEKKGEPRRVPIWAGVAVAVVAMFAVPALLDALTGKYQDASLRRDVNECTDGLLGQTGPYSVTNTCDHPIVVGLCQSNEENPAPCRQAVAIEPGATGTLDPNGEALASRPTNLSGFTIVACRASDRPSRTKHVGGRGYRGVCLPPE